MTDLILPEIVVFHAIRRDSQLYYDQRYMTAITAGAVIELLLRDRISLAETKRAEVTIIDTAPTGNELLDQALTDSAAAVEPEPVKGLLKRLIANTHYRRAAIDGLLASGQLTSSPRKILGLIKVKQYAESEISGADAVRKRLSEIMFGSSGDISMLDDAAIMLLGEHDLFRGNYPAEQLKRHQKSINDIRYGRRNETGALEAIRKAIASVRSSGGNAGAGAG